MKYEEIEVGESYKYSDGIETVISKIDSHKMVISEDKSGSITALKNQYYKNFQPITPKLPETGLLVHQYIDLIVYRTGKTSGYTYDEVANDFNFDSLDNYQPATPEQEKEFIEQLKQEAVRRGLLDDTKIEKCMFYEQPDTGYIPIFHIERSWNKNGCIFNQGKWATPLKDTTLDQITSIAMSNYLIEQTPTGIIVLTPLK